MVAETIPNTSAVASKVPSKRKIPDYLVRETIDGIPFFYAGYREVLNKKKSLEDIMADSGLQSIIKAYLMKLFAQKLDWEIFQPVSGADRSSLYNVSCQTFFPPFHGITPSGKFAPPPAKSWSPMTPVKAPAYPIASGTGGSRRVAIFPASALAHTASAAVSG